MKKPILSLFFLVAFGSACTTKTIVKSANTVIDPPFSDEMSPMEGIDDPLRKDQWSLDRIGLGDVKSGQGVEGTKRVSVAILSSGVDYNHEDLQANIWVNQAEARAGNPGDRTPVDEIDNDENGFVDDIIGYDFVDEDGYPFDRNGAGTAAAGIIGAVHGNGVGIQGINSQLSLVPVRYIGSSGMTYLSGLVRALDYVARTTPDVAFVHMANIDYSESDSVKDMEQSTLRELLSKIQKANVTVVVSAGNSGADVTRSRAILRDFSRYDNVAIVTAVDEKDARPFIANYGMEFVHTAAPGENVLSTLPGNRYGKVSGTFVAAAHVAGAVALAIGEHYGELMPRDYLKALVSGDGGDPISSLRFETVGGNRLNVARFFSKLE